jgi:putative transposase
MLVRMPRRARQAPGGLIYHVLNRAVGRMRMFTKDADYAAFVKVMVEAQKHCPMRLLAYSVMPNHWHMVLWPRADGELSRFMHWLTMTHTQRWRHHRQLVGLGPLYQGRFKAFPAQSDGHLLVVLRYVERNPLRAGLVQRAEDWRYSSLHDRLSNLAPAPVGRGKPVGSGSGAALAAPGSGTGALLASSPGNCLPNSAPAGPVLCDWPIPLPRDYVELVNEPQTAAEEQALRNSIRRGRPFGDRAWEAQMVRRLELQSSVNPEHRPKRLPPLGDGDRRKQ